MVRYHIRILPSAYEDIQIAKDWYKQHSSELPGRLVAQVDITAESISNNPFAFSVRYKNIRIANLAVFPYGIHFFINEGTETVVIIGVFHTSLSPDKWKRD